MRNCSESALPKVFSGEIRSFGSVTAEKALCSGSNY